METYNLLIPKDLKLQFQMRMLEEHKSMAEVIRSLMTDYLQGTEREVA